MQTARRAGLLLMLVALAAASPTLAQQQGVKTWLDVIRQLRPRPLAPSPEGRGGQGVRTSVVAESEANNTVATADSVTFGDQATGVVNPEGDVDVWSLDLEAGQFVSFDLDAQTIGSPVDAKLALFAPDGVTQLAFNDDFDGFDPRISFHITATGRYYVLVGAFGRAGGPELAYALTVTTAVCAAVGTEHEPNDTPVAATPVAVGAAVTGEICPADDTPAGDGDYWAFTANAGTAVELDVDAANTGLLVDPLLELFASDGVTRLSFNDDANGADPRLQFAFATTGTYYARVGGQPVPGANPFAYTLHVRSITPGRGDPIAVTAENLGFPFGMAVGSTGDLFVGDFAANRIVRITTTGQLTTFAAGITGPLGLAFDASGNLLVASTDGAVYRVSPAGAATRFITDAALPFWIAVAPDGRIWLTDVGDRSLRRYSATGRFETRIDAAGAGGFGPGPMALGPSGQPYLSTGADIWRVENGGLRRVLTDGVLNWAFVFDVDGNIYVPQPVAGRIMLFDANGATLGNPFALSPDAPRTLAFGREATGVTTARLFVTDATAGRLLELNPAGAIRPGLPVGYVAPHFSADVAAAALLGGAALSPADRQYLDAIGNHNGRYDVGDLQALLRTLNVGSNR